MSFCMLSFRKYSSIVTTATILLLATYIPVAFSETTTSARPQAPIIIMSHMQSADSGVGCWLKSVYTEAFRRLGYTMQYRQLPAARATYAAEHGTIDGELGRSQHYAQAHPTLTRVEEPHLTERFIAYVLAVPSKPLDWDSLIKSNLNIGFRNGVQLLQEKLADVPSHRLNAVNSTEAGFNMLVSGRIDVFIETGKMFRQQVPDGTFNNFPIYSAGVLDTHSAHAYLGAGHAQLAIPLAATLRRMKKEGLLARYAKECNFDYVTP